MALARGIGARALEHQQHLSLGFLALSGGDIRGAEAEIRRRLWSPCWRRGGWVIGDVALWAETLVVLDRSGEGTRLLELAEEVSGRLDQPSALAACARVRGLMATAARDEEAAVAAFTRALAYHDRVPEPFERARTLLAQGESLRRFRRRGHAREALAGALAIFAELGAPRWQERAASELARTGHRESGSDLSPTEGQIARLVAAGRTNREVAETLFMSTHTVEAHLTRIYRSLGVRGRTELARADPRDAR